MFNPKQHSVILACNMSNTGQDLAMIRTFYTGLIHHLKGCYDGMVEKSYQLDVKHINHSKMVAVMHRCEQDMILFVNTDGSVRAGTRDSNYYVDNLSYICGFMTKTDEPTSDYTQCMVTKEYWEIR